MYTCLHLNLERVFLVLVEQIVPEHVPLGKVLLEQEAVVELELGLRAAHHGDEGGVCGAVVRPTQGRHGTLTTAVLSLSGQGSSEDKGEIKIT